MQEREDCSPPAALDKTSTYCVSVHLVKMFKKTCIFSDKLVVIKVND